MQYKVIAAVACGLKYLYKHGDIVDGAEFADVKAMVIGGYIEPIPTGETTTSEVAQPEIKAEEPTPEIEADQPRIETITPLKKPKFGRS